MYFRQSWKDPRLRYDDSDVPSITLNGDLSDSFWQPDTIFENEVEGKVHTLLAKNKFYRIHRDGLILTSTRLTLTCSCSMDFRKFPMDEQECGIYLVSYGYTTQDIVYEWQTKHETWSNEQDIPQFLLKNISRINITRRYSTGKNIHHVTLLPTHSTASKAHMSTVHSTASKAHMSTVHSTASKAHMSTVHSTASKAHMSTVQSTVDARFPHYGTSDYSALGIKMRFTRRLGHYFTKVYIPAILIVMLSWLSFYVDRRSAPARVSLGITTVLTMTTLLIGIGQGSLPVVAYVKALDWYLFVSYFMVFAAFAEYAVINYRDGIYRRSKTEKRLEENGSTVSHKVNTMKKTLEIILKSQVYDIL
ncbi:Gamma-aminobutyric acid receptor alpha-like [Exaiptasia diaphana]|nr:Gamma-aminobutyric acid receptor alpha-like [Exaiptasia diaphana]